MGDDYIDAKFKVIHRRRWRIGFDWRNFLIVSAMAVAAAARSLVLPH